VWDEWPVAIGKRERKQITKEEGKRETGWIQWTK
jgi:hypothetical protein